MIRVFTEGYLWTDIKNNTHAQAMEMYRVANDVSSDIMNEVFKLRNIPHYNIQHTSHFPTDPAYIVYNRTELASYLGPKIWVQISAETKNKDSLDIFKEEIKKWKPTECPCRICKTFVPNLGFVW